MTSRENVEKVREHLEALKRRSATQVEQGPVEEKPLSKRALELQQAFLQGLRKTAEEGRARLEPKQEKPLSPRALELQQAFLHGLRRAAEEGRAKLDKMKERPASCTGQEGQQALQKAPRETGGEDAPIS